MSDLVIALSGAPPVERAWAIFRAGAVAAAYAMAKPLFASYPPSVAVQDLRCELAAVRHLERAEVLSCSSS